MAGWVPIQSYNRDMADANASSRDRDDYRRRWNEAEDEIDVLKQRIKELESTAAPSFPITFAKTMSSSHNSAPATLS
jgi:epoxyqueuosine reductase QueG